jgi:hypothetical protein
MRREREGGNGEGRRREGEGNGNGKDGKVDRMKGGEKEGGRERER